MLCGACKGARFNSETLEVTLRGKTIDDILNMSVEEGVAFSSYGARPAKPSMRARLLHRASDSQILGLPGSPDFLPFSGSFGKNTAGLT